MPQHKIYQESGFIKDSMTFHRVEARLHYFTVFREDVKNWVGWRILILNRQFNMTLGTLEVCLVD